jgi:hypothetical protein
MSETANLPQIENLDYQNQAKVFIRNILEEIKIKDVGSEIAAFKNAKVGYILRHTLNKEQPFEILFNNPSLGFKISKSDADEFFESTILDKKTFKSGIYNLVSTKGFVSSIGDDTLRKVITNLIEDKETTKLLTLFASPHIIDRMDVNFFQSLYNNHKQDAFNQFKLDTTTISRILELTSVYAKFKEFLKNYKDAELVKLLTTMKTCYVSATLQIINEDPSFKNTVITAVEAKLKPTTILKELMHKNDAYITMISRVPELRKIFEANIDKKQLASFSPNDTFDFFKKLNGEAVNMVFNGSITDEDRTILQNLSLAFASKSNTELDNWYTSTKNGVIEFLAKENVVQEPFIRFIKQDTGQKAVSKYTKVLLMNGNVELFKILASQPDLVELMQTNPGDLLFDASRFSKPSIVKAIAQNDFLSGRLYEDESEEYYGIVDKFIAALEITLTTKQYQILEILRDDFPGSYFPAKLGTSDESELHSTENALKIEQKTVEAIISLNCQFQNQDRIKEARSATKDPINPSPDPCDEAYSLKDLSNGFELERVNATELSMQLRSKITPYEALLKPDLIELSNNSAPTIERIVYVPLNKTVYVEKDFGTKVMEAAPYFAAVTLEAAGTAWIYMQAKTPQMIAPFAYKAFEFANINAYCKTLGCKTVTHGEGQPHVTAYNQLFAAYKSNYDSAYEHFTITQQNQGNYFKQGLQMVFVAQTFKVIALAGDGIYKVIDGDPEPKVDLAVVFLAEFANLALLVGIGSTVAGATTLAVASGLAIVSAYGISHIISTYATPQQLTNEEIFQNLSSSEQATPKNDATADATTIPEDNPLHNDQHNHNAQDEL